MPREGVRPAPPWPLPESGKLFAVQSSAADSGPGCGGNGAEEGESVGKLKGLCSDRDVRNCNGKRESADFGSCDGVKRARLSIEKVRDERNGPNRWGVESGIADGLKRSVDFGGAGMCGVAGANSGMKQPHCRQSVEGKGVDGMKQSHFRENFEARMGDQRIREKEKDRATDGMSRQSHFEENFEARMGGRRIREKEKARAIDGLSRQSQFKKNFESRMGDHRIREKVKVSAFDGMSMSRQSPYKKSFEARMGEQRIRGTVKARAIGGIKQSPHSKKSFKARMGDQRISDKVKARSIDGMSRQFQFGGQTRRKGYNKMGNDASGRVLERAAFSTATSSLSQETGPNGPVGNSGRFLGRKMGSGNQRRGETSSQVQGRASWVTGVRLHPHPRAVKLCFIKSKCKFSIKSSARIVDGQDRTQGNGASCLPKKGGILQEGDSNIPEPSQGREQAMGLKSEANGSSMQGASDREKVKKVLRLFQLCCKCLPEEAKADYMIKHKRVDARAYEILRQRNCLVNTGEPILGNVAGVEVGDEFQYRLELCVIGLHRPTVNGIDYIRGRRNLATSIVSSGVYDDIIFDLDTIIYTGEGGRPKAMISSGVDQQLTNGNLALKKSLVAGTPVRVIRGIRKPLRKKTKKTRPSIVIGYIYYGLYVVENYWSETGLHGFLEFKFQLRRMPGQPKLKVAEAINCRKLKPKEGIFCG